MFESLKDKKRSVILSTDIGPDCDDVGAIAVLWSLADEIGFPVIGMVNCTSNRHGVGAIEGINAFCGHGKIPLGEYTGRGLFEDEESSRYNKHIAEKFGGGAMAVGHIPFYRRLLAEAEDDSVILVTIGMFTDIADLLESGADGYSELCGVELVRRKVHCAVSMATRYPSGREFNIHRAPEAAKRFFRLFPKDIYIDDFFIGKSVRTGFVPGSGSADDPIYESYRRYTMPWGESCMNASFDLLAVHFAAVGVGEYYRLGRRGRVEFYNEDKEKLGVEDATRFIEDEGGNLIIIEKNTEDAVIEAELNRRLRSFSVLK